MFSAGPRKLLRSGYNAIDSGLCDAAKFHLATVGMADASAIGRLWVDYDVDLFIPQTGLGGYALSALTQTLHPTADVVMAIDSNWHTLPLTSITQNLYTTMATAGRIELPRGIYSISGVIHLTTSAENTATFNLQPAYNSEASGTTCAPTGYAQLQRMRLATSPGVGSMASFPFKFIVRIDADGDYIALIYNNYSTPGAGTFTIYKIGTIVEITPL